MLKHIVAAAWTVALALSALPALAAPPLEVYGQLPGVEMMSLSPSGARLATLAVVGDERSLLVTSLGGDLLVRAPVGPVKVRDIDWAGEDHLLVTISQTASPGWEFGPDKYELYSVLHLDLRTGKSLWVFKDGTRTSPVMGSYGARQIDGVWYGFYATMPSVYDPRALYQVNLDTGRARLLLQGREVETSWVIGAEGQVVAYSEYSQASGRWALFTPGHKLLTDRKDAYDGVSLAGLGRTPDTVLVEDVDPSGAGVIQEIPLSGGAPVTLGEKYSVRHIVHDREGRLIGFATREEPGYQFLAPKLQARYKGARKSLADYRVDLVSSTDDLGRMVLFTDAGDDSGSYWLVDISTGSARQLGAAYPSVRPADVGPTRMVKYKAADGLDLEGVLTLPPGREPKGLPVVIMPHGGPIVPGDEPGFDWWAQAFASRGYAVFQPNYRGTLGYGSPFVSAAYGEWGGKMQSDLSDGLRALAAEGIVDPKRACIVGASYGGYAALAGVTVQTGVYRCAVSVGGLSDLKAWLRWTADRNDGNASDEVRWWRLLMGARSENDALLKAASPALQAARADAPVLLIHGRDDTVVPISQSREMEKELKRAGKPVEFQEMAGEDHWMSTGETRLAMLKASVAFVERYNPPEAAAQPAR